MPKGRKPKPTAVKLLEGSRLTAADKSQPPTVQGTTDPPSWLSGLALSHWQESAPIVQRKGLLTEDSKLAWAMVCEFFRRSQTGKRCGADLDRYMRGLAEFGFTPASNSRIKSTNPPAKDALAVFLEEQA